MWTPVSVPYARPRTATAERLPTASEIRDCPFEISRRTGERIVALPFYVIKYGAATKAREGQALLYLEDCVPEVPTPRLLSMFQDSEDFFIVMERVPGPRLDHVWDSLSETEKDEICSELKAAFASMRNQTCPWCPAATGLWMAELCHIICSGLMSKIIASTGHSRTKPRSIRRL
ncbi:hypothetical protein EJ03DRAFT_173009 [Teratosphaeria nubilosa]|uniref:Aminoglycoside phosphotransferase domain-containing protein n=1 Tax=Teratosphaeria nubilosa TaxID=161662 RepID=A0A6G1LKE5_9PEZI|nr:hypothetical protein EJ03DRAFT_173009 [Teratosphaeria nubilosa]